MKTLQLIRILPVIAALGLCAMSPAPIKDNRTGVKVEREKTDEQRSAEQRGMMMGETGLVKDIDGRDEAPPLEHSSVGERAMSALDAAERGREAVKTASADVKKGPEGGNNVWKWIIGVLVVCGSFGLVQAFKHWANKNLPDAPGFK